MERRRPRPNQFLRNPGLVKPLEALFTKYTSPEARWLARASGIRSVPDHLPPIRTLNDLYSAQGVAFYGYTVSAGVATWAYLLNASGELHQVLNRPDAFYPRDTEWPLDHPVLERVSPFIWAGSYHPEQGENSPLLHFKALDALTAWALNLTDVVDHDAVTEELALAQTMPGFKVWTERRNILPAYMPTGQDAVRVMETRYELLDAPLRDPLFKRRATRQAFRSDLDVGSLPRFNREMIPFSNGKPWQMLHSRPQDRWSLGEIARGTKLSEFQRDAPYMDPKGGAHEVSVADGVYFRSLRAAARYFRVPYETVKARVRRGSDLATALDLTPLYFWSSGATRATSYPSHWHRRYMRTED